MAWAATEKETDKRASSSSAALFSKQSSSARRKLKNRSSESTGLPDDHLAVAVALEVVPAVPPAFARSLRNQNHKPDTLGNISSHKLGWKNPPEETELPYPMGGAEPRPLASMLRRCASSTCTTLPPPPTTATAISSRASLAGDEPPPPAIAPLSEPKKPSLRSARDQ